MGHTRTHLVLAALLGVGVGIPGCSKVRAPAEATEARNVVLISIDTCRSDHLSCYGYPRSTTPNIDAVAREGILFENVITPVASTLPAHCSMLTGMNPPYHGVHANNCYRLPESSNTLAEVLKEQGFTTAAFVGAYALDSQFGLAQGFDTYDEDMGEASAGPRALNERSAEAVNRAVLAWLEKHATERFFLFVHYYDAHSPYVPPEPYRSKLAGDAYAGEIAYADSQIGKLIDRLKRLELYDSTLLIITADHGEGLGQHGEKWHAFFVYHDTTKVPLVIKSPGRTKAVRIVEKVGLIDIFPTVLASVGVTAGPKVHGRDLSPHFAGRTTRDHKRYFYSESLVPTIYRCNALFALEDQSWKYIQSARPELYDLAHDPGEKKNLFAQEPQRARAFRNRLRQLLTSQTRTRDDPAKVPLDAVSQKRLQSLGYLGGDVQETIEFESDKEDPKDFVTIYEKLVVVTNFYSRGDAGGVERLCNEILAIRPDVPKAHEFIGIVTPVEELEKRRYHFLETLKYDPSSAEAHFGLGNVFGEERKLAESETHFREAARLAELGSDENTVGGTLSDRARVHPILFKAKLHLGDTLAIQRRYREAIEVYNETLFLDTFIEETEGFLRIKAYAFYRLGVMLSEFGRWDEAVNAFDNALDLVPGFEPALKGLDRVSTGRARFESSVDP